MASDANLEALVDLYPWKPALALFRALERRGVRRHLGLLSSPILDLGCGNGEINRLFLTEFESVGIDWNPAPLPHAQRLLHRVVRADARRLPFEGSTFGAVFGNCAIEHFPEIDLCLAEVARVLRAGGTFIATVPGAHWKELYVWNRVLSSLGLPRVGRRIVDAHDRRMDHYNLFGPKEWAQRLGKAGLVPMAFDPYLAPRGAWVTTFLESITSLPFPFPGFFKESGTYYFTTAVLKRLGGPTFWKRVFLKLLQPLYDDHPGPDGISAGMVVVAQKDGGG